MNLRCPDMLTAGSGLALNPVVLEDRLWLLLELFGYRKSRVDHTQVERAEKDNRITEHMLEAIKQQVLRSAAERLLRAIDEGK